MRPPSALSSSACSESGPSWRIAAVTTTTVPIQDTQLVIVVAILTVVLAIFGIGFGVLRKSLPRLFYVVGAGMLFGFVATLAKVLITRIQTILQTGFHLVFADWLTVVCFVGPARRRPAWAATSSRPRTPPAHPAWWSPASPSSIRWSG